MASSRVVLPVLQLEQGDDPYVKKVLKGAKQFTEQIIQPQSTSNSSTSFSFQPPSQNTIIDRCIMLQTDIEVNVSDNKKLTKDESGYNTAVNSRVTTAGSTYGFPCKRFTGLAADISAVVITASGGTVPAIALNSSVTVTGGGLGRPKANQSSTPAGGSGLSYIDGSTGNNLSLRQFPLANCMQSLDVTINGTHFTATVGEYIQAIMKYTTPEFRQKVFAFTAHAPDRADSLMAYTGYEQDPMNLNGEGSFLGESPRGQMTSYAVASGSGSKVTFKNVREPLFLSPLMQYFGHGMTNINEITVTINWAPSPETRLLNYLVSVNKGVSLGTDTPDVGNIKASFPLLTGAANAPALVVRYYTAASDLKIPAEISLPYNQPYKISTTATVDTANPTPINGNNIRLNQIPSAVYLWIQRPEGTRNNANMMANPDYFLPITNVEIQFGNQNGLLANLTESQLIDLSVENGLDNSIPQEYFDSQTFKANYCIKLVFGKDIPLADFESPGVRGDYNFQVNVTCKGNTTHAKPKAVDGTTNVDYLQPTEVNLKQLFILSGKAIIRPQECITETGIMSVQDVTNAEDMGMSYDDLGVEGGSLVGGSAVGGSYVGGSSVGGGFGSLAKALPSIVMKRGHKMVDAVAPTIKDVVEAYRSRS